MTPVDHFLGGSSRQAPRLTAQEVICNLPLGPDFDAMPLGGHEGGDVSDALETVILEALERPPCFVSFSGGRDSSAVLAAAVEIARRHGLDEPIPAIMRLPDDPESDELEWQELVLNHLGITHEEVITITDQHDALGPMAVDVLARHGLLWPGNAFAHRPIIDLARGGSVLTGIGGDEVLTAFPPLTFRHRLLLTAPYRLREVWLSRRVPFHGFDWLTPVGQLLARRGYAQQEASEWLGWDRTIREWYRSRAFSGLASGIACVADGHDVKVVNPFIHEKVLVELLHLAGPDGFGSRYEAMKRLFGHLLPEAILARQTKATFGGGLWGPKTRSFMSAWTGEGVDRRLVDPRRLREEFERIEPDFRTILLVQQAGLYGQFSRSSTS